MSEHHEQSARGPIFIHGIIGRSGTNYLARLLELHPDCHLTSLPEDWLLSESHHLSRYTKAMSAVWQRDPEWERRPDAEERLTRSIGEGLLSFLSEECDGKRLISKTPSVRHLPNLFTFFPDAYLLILVRDGRSVVESSVRSFDNDPHDVTAWWGWAANQILEFDAANRDLGRRYRIIRYEDLAQDPGSQMAEILRFLDLDPEAYDSSEMESLPVFGSSTSRNTEGNWEWQVSPATGDLGSLERWSDWSRGQHERFNWAAGDRLEALGYERKRFKEHRAWWFVLTFAWASVDWFKRAYSWGSDWLSIRLRGEG